MSLYDYRLSGTERGEVSKVVCLMDDYCRLCQFDFESNDLGFDDDAVYPVLFGGFLVGPFRYRDCKLGHHAWPTAGNAGSFGVCACPGTRCRRHRDPLKTAAIHVRCLKFAGNCFHPTLLTSTRFNYKPAVTEVRRRKKWLVSNLTRELAGQVWPRPLPYEAWNQIASYLLPEFAAVKLADRISRGQRDLPSNDWGFAEESFIDLTLDVWACHVELDGLSYISRLRNQRPGVQFPPRKGEVLLSKGIEYIAASSRIWIEENHLGIKQIRFGLATSYPPPESVQTTGGWWKSIPVHGMPWYRTRSDGLKLRDLVHMECDDGRLAFPYLYLQRLTVELDSIDLTELQIMRNVRESVYMLSFRCNAPDTTGYSIATDGRSLFHIHAHIGEQADYEFYRECGLPEDESHHWIYMPVSKDERIVGIQKLVVDRDREFGGSLAGLTFLTDHRRDAYFGGYEPPGSVRRLSRHGNISPVTADETRIYFNKKDPGNPRIDWICTMPGPPNCRIVDSHDFYPSSQRVMTRQPEDASPSFYSSCLLHGAEQISFCIDSVRWAAPVVVGMLLKYCDGHRERAGHVRFDWLTEPFRVNLMESLNFAIELDDFYRVGDVVLSPMSKEEARNNRASLEGAETLRGNRNAHSGICSKKNNPAAARRIRPLRNANWLSIPLCGTLEWWFSADGCRVYHREMEPLHFYSDTDSPWLSSDE
ncbi:hypothetical protein NKR23_g1001 [Pleurostoma richardsiae]|uniref:Uncharacterized protein n=1 Tax=Pleurostoma richardsiae TaxID=41990 RepID=A0AA38RR89_9PEZI|nr:hypothetical protein NKR23_g1001 [Pleurostoma richardsiae]